MLEQSLQLFQYQNIQVRTVRIENEPWFIAKDVFDALTMGWAGAQSLDKICDAWKLTQPLVELGQNRPLWLINEKAVYKLAFRSNKPEAERFTDWVAGEVLPAIRKAGRYELACLSPAEMILAQAQRLVDHEKQLAEQSARLAQVENSLTQIEAHRQQAQTELFAVERALLPAAEIPTRGKLNQLVRNYAEANHLKWWIVWSRLYRELYYRKRINVRDRARNQKAKPLDIIEAAGLMDETFRIASEVLK